MQCMPFGQIVLFIPQCLSFVREVLFTEQTPGPSGFLFDINLLNVKLLKYLSIFFGEKCGTE